MAGEESPQRANLRELVSNASVPAEYYWKNVEGITNARMRDIGNVAIFGENIPEDVQGTTHRVRNTFRKNGSSLKRGLPQSLVAMEKRSARKQAHESYFKLGVLSHPRPKGEYTTTLIPALENHRSYSLDPEQAAYFLTQTDHEKNLEDINISGKNSLTHRNILTAMLGEAGAYFLDPKSEYADTSSGEAILDASQSLLEVVTLDSLDNNPMAASMLLRRSYSSNFYELHRQAKALDKPWLIEGSYRQTLADNIDTYLSWSEHGKSQPGLAFEWVADIDFREYILSHEMYDSAYVQSVSPGEDFPIHNMRGGPLDNKQSIDLTVFTNERPHFIQCKINGAGARKASIRNKKNVPGYDKASGWYAEPITMLYATDIFKGRRGRNKDRDEYLMDEFSKHVKDIKERILNPYDNMQLPKHDALLAGVLSH